MYRSLIKHSAPLLILAATFAGWSVGLASARWIVAPIPSDRAAVSFILVGVALSAGAMTALVLHIQGKPSSAWPLEHVRHAWLLYIAAAFGIRVSLEREHFSGIGTTLWLVSGVAALANAVVLRHANVRFQAPAT